MFEKLLAGLTLAVCVVLLLRMCLGARRQHRLDAGLRRTWYACRRFALSPYRWFAARKEAARVAEEAIKRARGGGEWDGNVYKPKSFRKPRKPH